MVDFDVSGFLRERGYVNDSANDTRDELSRAIREAEGTDAYVEDFGDGWVVYHVWEREDDRSFNYRRSYTMTGDEVTLGDDRVEVDVVRRTEYRESSSSVDMARERAFVTEVGDKVLVTAPFRQVAGFADERVLKLRGRLVGSEEPNRNKALWTTGDLEIGLPTVALGPLNWLHEEKKVIGVISDSRIVTPSKEAAKAGPRFPYIEADSQVWRWLNQGEVAAVEGAASAGKLWYSMECVSERVLCMEEDCGAAVSYVDYLNRHVEHASDDVACDHMRSTTSVRRFDSPTFLGAAVILPPVSPGWADADLAVMEEAASIVEKAYERAGRPAHLEDDWESMIAQVVAFARV